MGTKTLKRPHSDTMKEAGEDEAEVPLTRRSEDEPVVKASRWTNKTRVLVLAARNINYRGRHLMTDIKVIKFHVYIIYKQLFRLMSFIEGHDATWQV